MASCVAVIIICIGNAGRETEYSFRRHRNVFIGFRLGECEMLFPSCIHGRNLCCERTFYGCIERQQQCKMHNSRESPIWIYFYTAEGGIMMIVVEGPERHKHHCAFSAATMQCRTETQSAHRKKAAIYCMRQVDTLWRLRLTHIQRAKRTARHSRHITTWQIQKSPLNAIVFYSWFDYSGPSSMWIYIVEIMEISLAIFDPAAEQSTCKIWFAVFFIWRCRPTSDVFYAVCALHNLMHAVKRVSESNYALFHTA